jgi:hypothetical protein
MAAEITHVAVKIGETVWALPAPARHHHVLWAIYGATGDVKAAHGVQGFLDATGAFLTREETFARTGKGRGKWTFSEDLWDSPPSVGAALSPFAAAEEYDALKAENERLREALTAIRRLSEPVAAEIARAALAGEKGEK